MAQLSKNTSDLDLLIQKANALPNAPIYETWVFELEDGTVVEKQVEVSSDT